MLFDRVAQLRVPVPGGTAVGSGYLVGDRLVLTAAHIVGKAGAPAGPVVVRFPGVDLRVTGEVVWSGTAAGLDAALVALADPVAGLRWRPARWGRLTGQRPGVAATAVGFPRVLRAEDGTRVLEQPSGTVNPGVAFGERYDLNVDPSASAGRGQRSLPVVWAVRGVLVLQSSRPPVSDRGGGHRHPPLPGRPADERPEHGLSAMWESVELAALFDRPAGRLDSPASLLRADNAVVRFRGRAQSLRSCRAGATASGRWHWGC